MSIKKNIIGLINTKKILSICVLGLALVSCSKQQEAGPKPSGFLPNYSMLKPIKSPEGTQIYLYKDPSVKRSDYNAVIVNPVTLYQTATKNGVTEEQIAAARADLNAGIKNIVSQSTTVTTKPGPGVATLSVAITGATVTEKGFSPLNLVPISAAIKLASRATDLDSKTPVLVVELKFTDSVTGKLLMESVSVVSGDTFRQRSNTPKEFQALAKTWIQQGLQYSLDQR